MPSACASRAKASNAELTEGPARLRAAPSFAGSPLNGTYTTTYALGFEHDDQTIVGAAANDLGSYNVTVTKSASSYQGDQSADLPAGSELGGYTAISDKSHGTLAEFLDGTLTADHAISTLWRAATPGEGPSGTNLLSDVLTITGLSPTPGSELFVLQMTAAAAIDPVKAAAGKVFLAWLNGSDQWVNAVMGNSNCTSVGSPILRATTRTWATSRRAPGAST